MNKYEKHAKICEALNETYRAKNADYGDSFARIRKEEGDATILVRLKDKLYRLESLLHGNEIQVKDEKIGDTLLDLANYCLMEIVERWIDEEEEEILEIMEG